MLSRSVDPSVRHLFKTIEFGPLNHLLEVSGLSIKPEHIETPPVSRGDDDRYIVDNADALQQAMKDSREVITANGHALPPVFSRKAHSFAVADVELRTLLAQKQSSQRRSPTESALP
jgi:hypothetical protein